MNKFYKIAISLILLLCITTSFALAGCKNKPEIDDSFDENLASKAFPFMYINIEDGKEVTSKDEYLSCNVKITNTEQEYTLNKTEAKIKVEVIHLGICPKNHTNLNLMKRLTCLDLAKLKNTLLLQIIPIKV